MSVFLSLLPVSFIYLQMTEMCVHFVAIAFSNIIVQVFVVAFFRAG